MSAALTLDTSGLRRLANKFGDPAIQRELMLIPQRKAVAAMVGQAIADNFNQEGPGWAPLKASTIRNSVSAQVAGTKVKVGGKLKDLSELSDEELEKHEAKARKNPGTSKEQPFRRILRKSGALFGAATTPGARGNIWKTDGAKLIWGVDLIYAGVHNYGFPPKKIPKREFLTIRKQWMDQIEDYIIQQSFRIISEKILQGES